MLFLQEISLASLIKMALKAIRLGSGEKIFPVRVAHSHEPTTIATVIFPWNIPNHFYHQHTGFKGHTAFPLTTCTTHPEYSVKFIIKCRGLKDNRRKNARQRITLILNPFGLEFFKGCYQACCSGWPGMSCNVDRVLLI